MNENEKEIKMLYEDNVQRTAPDMEKLWSRIENSIDEAENKTDAAPVRAIESSKGRNNRWRQYLAAAAVFAVIASVGMIFLNKETPRVKNDTTVSQSSDAVQAGQKADGTMNKSEQEGGNGAPDAQKRDAAAEDAEPSEQHENAPSKTAEAYTDGTEDLKRDYSAVEDNKGLINSEDYVPVGEKTFAESEVLGQTELFLDCRVKNAEPKQKLCYYTVEVINCYTRGGSGFDRGETVTVISSGALLKEGTEYLLPLRKTEEGYRTVFENAPQTEFVSEDRIVFYDGWQSLYADSEEYEYSESKYGKMRTAPAASIAALIQKWQEQS